MKIGTPFKAHTLEITLSGKKKIRNSMNFSTLFRFYGPVYTNPFSNENGAVLLRTRLSSTLYHAVNDHRKRSQSKTRSRVERFENDAFLKRCVLVWTEKTMLSENIS